MLPIMDQSRTCICCCCCRRGVGSSARTFMFVRDDDELLKVYCPSRRLLWSADPEARLVLLNHSVCVALCTALCQLPLSLALCPPPRAKLCLWSSIIKSFDIYFYRRRRWFNAHFFAFLSLSTVLVCESYVRGSEKLFTSSSEPSCTFVVVQRKLRIGRNGRGVVARVGIL